MSRGTKRKTLEIDPSLLSKEKLILICEWESCRNLHEDVETFFKHVAEHAGQIGITVQQKNGINVNCFVCLWEECDYETTNDKEILRHLYYHAYHTKVKCLGATLIERLGLQGCQLGPQNRNTIPELPEPFICGWKDCLLEFLNVQHFYWHIHSHAEESPTLQNEFRCLWEGCESKFPKKVKLKDHLRFHSQERPISCPTCGTLFASRTKLHDHCLRQLPAEAQEYKCPECDKKLPTERILRDHVRTHRTPFECHLCPENGKKGFWSRAALVSHITYRHMNVRAFACNHADCNHRSKSQADLAKHMECHADPVWYCCQNPGCEFTAQTVQKLQRHIRKVHEGRDSPQYECHECKRRFQFNSSLRKHLIKLHKMSPANGASRFKYKTGEDGITRVVDCTTSLTEN